MRPVRILSGMLFFLVAATGHAQSMQAACNALTTWDGGPDDLRIEEARFETGGTVTDPNMLASLSAAASTDLPPHCYLAGSFEHRTGVDGVEYAIRFAMRMPEAWNGRFLFMGGGGMNGVVQDPIGMTGAYDVEQPLPLQRGFAVATTDTGHVAGEGMDASFMRDQQALLNFQFEANAKTTAVAHELLEAWYGSGPHHNYFLGCSTGGREGMIMAQRYPQLFDGIVSGAPALQTTVTHLGYRWMYTQFVDAGLPNPRNPFTPEDIDVIMNGLTEQCDALDGNADGLIFNRSACDFDPRDLACSVNTGGACLADAKAEALALGMAGPTLADGTPIYASYPYDTGIDEGLLISAGNMIDLVAMIGHPSGPLRDVGAEYIAARQTSEAIGSTAYQFNVSTFINNGGKHIYFHGEADPAVSANDTVRYFDAMADYNSAVAPVEDYARLYLVPGMGHCGGGERTVDSHDLLTPLIDWVENGIAPESLTATGRSMPGESRPLCPYPSYAHFAGGDPGEASSYECRAP